MTIEGVGSAEIEVSEASIAFQGEPPPVCDQRVGTWTGISSDLEGESGTFTLVSQHPRDASEEFLSTEATTLALIVE